MSINIEVLKFLFLKVKENPEITEDELLDIAINLTGHSLEQEREWFSAIINALYESFVIDERSFDSLKNKAIKINENDFNEKILFFEKIINEYLKSNPINYIIEEEKQKILNEISELEKEPDEITVPNDYKIQKLEELKAKLNEYNI